jgi:hypothetical protein
MKALSIPHGLGGVDDMKPLDGLELVVLMLGVGLVGAYMAAIVLLPF